MAAKALNQPSNLPKSSEEEKDPLEEATKFTKQMAASAIIESEVTKSKAGADEAKARAEEAKAKAERARGGGGEGSEGPFKVTGGVSLGNIDLQRDREEARTELERLKKEADEAARATGQENQQLRDKIHEQEIKMLNITFQAQMEVLTKMIESSTSKKSFIEQYTEAMETAKTLGYQQTTPQPGSEMIQLELKKLDFDHTLALKKMTREDRAEGRKWDLELRRLDDERKAKEAELAQQQKRDEMIASAPQMIGGAIAKGMMESKGGGEAPAAPKTSQRYELPVPQGEEGVTHCPKCGTEMGVGPTAKSAICAKCNTKVFIKRVGKSEKPAAEESGERHREEE